MDTLVSERVCGPKAGVKKTKQDTAGVSAFRVPARLRTIFEGFGGLRAFVVFLPQTHRSTALFCIPPLLRVSLSRLCHMLVPHEDMDSILGHLQ